MRKLLLLALALFVCADAGAAPPMFRNPLPVSTGVAWNGYLLAADFDGDSRDDVLMVTPADHLSVLLANGTGPFAAPKLTPIPDYYTYQPGIGDINGDGKRDVVISDWSTRKVASMLGNGDGTFTAGPTFVVNMALPGPLTLADFNGDHKLDVAVGSQDTHDLNTTLEVWFGTGTGQFSGTVTTVIDGALWTLDAADMNGDAKMDLVSGAFFGARVLLGNGSGGFTEVASGDSGTVLLRDFNHDNKMDVAIADGGTHGMNIAVALGNGDGTLGTPARYPAAFGLDSFDAADIDGDGNLDLLAAGLGITVLRGRSDGTFHEPEYWASGPQASGIVARDFDRDDKVDFVATAYWSGRSMLSFVRGRGDGTFHLDRAIRTTTEYPWGEVTGGHTIDMNDDGKLDVVILQRHQIGDDKQIGVLLNDGSGRLARPIYADTGLYDPSLLIGDVNQDGNPDAITIVRGDGELIGQIYRGNGDGTFGSPSQFTVVSPYGGATVLGHFNGDTTLDLLVGTSESVTVYPGNGGSFGTGIVSNVSALDAQFVDLNGDGKLDLLSTFSSLTTAINDGNGHFTYQFNVDDDATAAVVADFNGDQKLDVFTPTYDYVVTRFGNGDGTFGAPVYFTMRPKPNYDTREPGTAGDFDGDGKIDVVFGTTVYLSEGDGTFRSAQRFRTGAITAVHAADMDGNGTPDLVTLRRELDDVQVLRTNVGPTPVTSPSSIELVADHDLVAYGQNVKLTATVTGSAVPLLGVVRFAVDGKAVGLIAVDKDGRAEFSTALYPGAHTITATYGDDENYASSTDSVAVTTTKATPVLTASGTPNPQSGGRTVTIKTKFQVSYPFYMPGPTGVLTVRDGATPIGTVALVTNGQMTINTLSVGSHVITVDYPGDDRYAAVSTSYTQVITKPIPVMTLEVAEPIMAGDVATFRAAFADSSVTGTVEFYFDSVYAQTLPMVPGGPSIQKSFSWGLHRIRIRYSGDSTWAAIDREWGFEVFIGAWGTPLQIQASGYGTPGFGTVRVQWSPILGAEYYTVWKKTSLLGAWSVHQNFLAPFSNDIGLDMEYGQSWLIAVTATDEHGNVTPMSAPDLASAISFNSITPRLSRISAQDIAQLRTAAGAVRTFAGLAPFVYTNPATAGQRIRAADVQELRTALAQARTAIGLPTFAFTDPTLAPGVTIVRAAHILELRAAAN